MALLDIFGVPPGYAGLLSPEEEQRARQQAQMQGLLGLASGFFEAAEPSPVRRGIGASAIRGLMAGQQMAGETYNQAIKGMLTAQQIQEMRRKQAEEEQIRQAKTEFQKRISSATSMQPTRQGVLDTQTNIDPMLLESMSAQDVIGMAPKTQQVTDQAAADRAVMDYLRVASPVEYAKLVAKEPRALPASIQEYQYAVTQGFKGTFEEFQEKMKKAGATSINLPSEGERKAGFLANRVKFGLEQMADVIGKNAPSASPEALPTLVKFLTQSDFLSTKLTSPDRQRIEAAQLDILDAALTLGTGAAYTKEQLEGYRKSYFPVLGEDPSTTKDKQARLQNLLESAYISAGRSAPPGPIPRFNPPAAPAPQFNKNDIDLINKYLPKK